MRSGRMHKEGLKNKVGSLCSLPIVWCPVQHLQGSPLLQLLPVAWPGVEIGTSKIYDWGDLMVQVPEFKKPSWLCGWTFSYFLYIFKTIVLFFSLWPIYIEFYSSHITIFCNCVYTWIESTQGWGWTSVIKYTGCPCRGPRFKSQYPHGGSQLSVTPVSGNLTPSSDPLGHQAHIWCSCKQNPQVK